MSDDEVAVRYFVAKHRRISDRFMCGTLLPPPQGLPLLRKGIDDLLKFREQPPIARAPTIANTMSSMPYIYFARWTLRRRIDALRIVEALRAYAPRHDGKLPGELEKIEGFGIPVDVMTGKPFEYRLTAEGAELSGPGAEIDGRVSPPVQYRVTVRRVTSE
jgi:hypothetical protein